AAFILARSRVIMHRQYIERTLVFLFVAFLDRTQEPLKPGRAAVGFAVGGGCELVAALIQRREEITRYSPAFGACDKRAGVGLLDGAGISEEVGQHVVVALPDGVNVHVGAVRPKLRLVVHRVDRRRAFLGPVALQIGHPLVLVYLAVGQIGRIAEWS